MKRICLLTFRSLLPVVLVFCTSWQPAEENWTHFRGNKLDGIAQESSAPLHWTADSNIVWKTAGKPMSRH